MQLAALPIVVVFGSGIHGCDPFDSSFGCGDDCGMNAHCVWNKCEPGCEDDTCPADTYCPSSGYSDYPMCQPGCHDQSECAAGTLCLEGKCALLCHDNSDCPAGNRCFEQAWYASGDPDFAGCFYASFSCATCPRCTCTDTFGPPPGDGGMSTDASAD
jgi:hypothetical protein